MASGFSYDPFGTGKNSFYNPFPKVSTSDPTTLQELEKLFLKNQKKGSTLGSLFRAIGHGLEKGLDVIAAPSHAIAEGVREATHGEANDFDVGRFLHGAKEGITLKKKTGFGEVLAEHSGFFRKHKVLAGIAGLGLDIGTDPVMLLSLAAAPELSPVLVARMAEREAAAGLERGSILKAIDVAQHGPKSIAEGRKAVDALKAAGPGFEARRALAEEQLNLLHTRQIPGVSSEALIPKMRVVHSAQALADAEHRADLVRKFAVGYTVPFGKKFLPQASRFVDRNRVVLRSKYSTPSLKTVAMGEHLVGKLPIVPKVAEQLGRAFKPNWDNDKFHALERVGRSVTEELDHNYVGRMQQQFGRFLSGPEALNEDQMLDALHIGETTEGIVRKNRAEGLKKSMVSKLVKEGKLSPKQADFLTEWHHYTEFLRAQDKRYGIKYDKTSPHLEKQAVYVPHMYTKEGRPITSQWGSSILVKPGFEYKRLANNLQSVKTMKELVDTGTYRNEVETNPLKLLFFRSRRGAQAQADSLMQDMIAKTYGVAKRVPDDEKIARLADEGNGLLEKADKFRLAKDPEAAWQSIVKGVSDKRDAKAAEAIARHAEKAKEIRKNIRSLKAKIGKTKQVDALPTGAKLVSMSKSEFDKAFAATTEKAKEIRRVGSRVRSRHQAAAKAEQQMRRLKPKTGAKVHGSEYKRILFELIRDSEPKILRGKRTEDEKRVIREARASWNHLKESMEKPLERRTIGEGAERSRVTESWEQRLKIAISTTKRNAKQEWNTYFDRELASRNLRRGDPLLKAQLATQERALKAHTDKLAGIHEKHTQFLEKDLGIARKAFDKRLGKEQAKVARINKRLDRIQHLVDREYTNPSKLNPKIPEGYVENTKLRDPVHGSSMMIPHEMDAALRRVRDAMQNDKFLEEFSRTWARLTARWKVAATVVNPGYRLRNTMSDLWNMYVHGVPLWAINKYGIEAAKVVKGLDQKDRELFLEAYDHGIFSGLFQGDVEKVLKDIKAGSAPARELAKKGHGVAAYTRAATDFNRHAENWGRLTHYLYRRQSLKESAVEAARHVKAAHFDYEDLTKTERSVKRNYIPFFTWTRKNIPYQVTSYLENPGRYATFSKLANESEFAAGDQGEGSVIPDWLQNQFAFRVPFGGKDNFFLPQFGPTDLAKLSSPAQAAGMLHPALKTGIELPTNKSLLTGAPIYGSELAHPRVPITGGPVAGLLGAIPGTDVGPTERKKGKGVVKGEGANPLVSYFASQTPATNIAVNQLSNIRAAQRGGKEKALLSYVLGVSTYAPDQEQQLGIKAQEEQKAFQQFVRGLRDEGKLPEPKRKKSAFQKERDKLLKQAYGT